MGSSLPTYAAGIDGTALNFAGSDDRVEINDDSTLDFGSGDFSISFWLNTSQVPGSTAHLVDKMDPGDEGFQIYTNSSGNLIF